MSSNKYNEAFSLFNKQEYIRVYDLLKPCIDNDIFDFQISTLFSFACEKNGKIEEALDVLRSLVKNMTDNIEANFNLASALEKSGKTQEAVKIYQRILEISPDYFPALVNTSNLKKSCGALSEAEAYCKRAITKEPLRYEPYIAMGNILTSQGQADSAISHYRKALELNPDSVQAASNLLLSLHYISHLSAQDIFDEHVKYGLKLERAFHGNISRDSRKAGEKIRIGYLSADFRLHSVAYFIEPVIYLHDRNHFEVFCYSDVLVPDEITARFKGISDHWRNISGLDNSAILKMIASDKIDILIDLSGYTGNRIELLAMKPPALLLTYLGYPDTTGL